jgi:hypothetical protein
MRRSLTSLVVLCLGLTGGWTNGQDAKPDAHRVVAIEVLIADLALSGKEAKDEPNDAVVDRIRESEKQGKLSRVTRLRLTTLSEQQAMAQYGERAPVSTGRASFPSGREFPGGGRGSGNFAESFTYHNVGTIAQITPRVDGNKVILECSVEQSRLVSKAPIARPDADAPGGSEDRQPAASSFQPESIETITARSTIQMKSGETVLLTSRQQQSGGEGLRTYILVTGTIQGE